MRISADSDDPGYAEYLRRGPVVTVVFNGEALRDIITADEEAGEVIRAARDENGAYMHLNGAVMREKLRGKVEIR